MDLESAAQDTRPQIQLLIHRGHVFQPRGRPIGAFQRQAQPAQIQPVRVFAQPVEEGLLAVLPGGIADLAAVSLKGSQTEFGGGKSRRRGRAVPPPLRLGTQRDAFP